MRVLGVICHELIGLFVDDGALAVALLVWTAFVGGAVLALPGLPAASAGAVLAIGCIAILLANIRRTARLRRP